MFELFGSTTTQQRLNAGPSSRMGMNVTPRLTVFHNPPNAAATYHTFGSFGSISMSAMRPVTRPGPSERTGTPFITSAGSAPAEAADRAWPGADDAASPDTRLRTVRNDTIRFTR